MSNHSPLSLNTMFRSFLLVLALLHFVLAQDDASVCSSTLPCYQGCCSKEGNCDFGPEFCGGESAQKYSMARTDMVSSQMAVKALAMPLLNAANMHQRMLRSAQSTSVAGIVLCILRLWTRAHSWFVYSSQYGYCGTTDSF